MQRFDSAIRALLEAKKLAPPLPAIDLNLGLAYYHQRDFAKAIPEFSQVLQSQADNYQARYLLGMSYFMQDEYQLALVTLEPLASAEQDNLDFLFVQAICYGKLKRGKESEKAFDRLVCAGGDPAHLHFPLGKAYLDLYIKHHAVTELQESIALAPKLSFAHYNLGVAYQRLGMLEKAGKEFDLEMTITP